VSTAAEGAAPAVVDVAAAEAPALVVGGEPLVEERRADAADLEGERLECSAIASSTFVKY
jgi:hypothetical protein